MNSNEVEPDAIEMEDIKPKPQSSDDGTDTPSEGESQEEDAGIDS